MKLNIFQGKDWPWWSKPLIDDIRQKHLTAGGDPVDFSDYLREQGIYFEGPILTISDKWETYVALKFKEPV